MSSTELWVLASTVIFLVLAWKPAKKAITGGLDARRDTIERELDEAHRLRQEAEVLLIEAQQRHQAAAKDAEGIVNFAQEEAQRMRAQAESDLKDNIARREKQAMDRIAQAETAAVADVSRRAVDIALAASAEILAGKLAGNDGDRMMDELIGSLPARLTAAR